MIINNFFTYYIMVITYCFYKTIGKFILNKKESAEKKFFKSIITGNVAEWSKALD